MITIYAPDAVDFSTLGEGALAPSECVIEEQALGQYALTMTHPMDAGGKWRMIAPGCILKAPAPVRETPLAVEVDAGEIPSGPETVTRQLPFMLRPMAFSPLVRMLPLASSSSPSRTRMTPSWALSREM